MTTRRRFAFGAAAVCAAAGGIASGGCVFMRAPRFGRLPEGDRLKRILAAPNYIGGAFRNERSAYIVPARPDDGRGGG